MLKTIETFDFAAQISINEPLARELLRGEYISKRENLLLVGNSGTGKTHLASALGFAACTQGKRVRFMTTTGLVTQSLAPAAHIALPASGQTSGERNGRFCLRQAQIPAHRLPVEVQFRAIRRWE